MREKVYFNFATVWAICRICMSFDIDPEFTLTLIYTTHLLHWGGSSQWMCTVQCAVQWPPNFQWEVSLLQTAGGNQWFTQLAFQILSESSYLNAQMFMPYTGDPWIMLFWKIGNLSYQHRVVISEWTQALLTFWLSHSQQEQMEFMLQ